VCVCVCVCERERESQCVCVYVCVCVCLCDYTLKRKIVIILVPSHSIQFNLVLKQGRDQLILLLNFREKKTHTTKLQRYKQKTLRVLSAYSIIIAQAGCYCVCIQLHEFIVSFFKSRY
jgi:hypothetical protein